MSSNLLTSARLAAVRRLQTGASSERSICSLAATKKDRTAFTPSLSEKLNDAQGSRSKRTFSTRSSLNEITPSLSASTSDQSWNLLSVGCATLLGAAWLSRHEQLQQQRRLQNRRICECEAAKESHPRESTTDQTPLLATMSYADPRSGILYPHTKTNSQLDAPKTTTVRAGMQSASKTTPSYKPYDLSVRAVRGQRLYMEDTYFVSPGGRFAAVFDGHGGRGVSSYLRDSIYPLALQELKRKQWEESDEIEDLVTASTAVVSGEKSSFIATNSRGASVSAHVAALRSAFAQAEEKVLQKSRWQSQGSTACAVWIHETPTRNGTAPQRTLVSANIGDSRAILSRSGKAIDLTRDHKPNEERERSRIMQLGESIEWDSLAKVHRVKSLSVSRTIGDAFAKPVVSSEADIRLHPVVEGQDEFVLVASDGLWDCMDSQDVVSYVHERFASEIKKFTQESSRSQEDIQNFKLVLRREMTRCLCREAIRRGSGDNVCILLIWLKK